MSKYLIHTCPKRIAYVQDYLIPSMLEQGIDKYDISFYLDADDKGCLESCMQSFLSLPANKDITWHLQDDIIISSEFRVQTETDYMTDIICGYCYELDKNKDKIGYVKSIDMWYSFPCIAIRNKIARSCADWFYNRVVHDNSYGVYVRSRKHDDTLFHIFMEDYWPDANILNLNPNLVDHIDYLIGGSTVNYIRQQKETHAVYFQEKELIKKLEEKLK